ncbi:hypothetical protein BCV70DRAFT_107245 [Testicularia cyperi]|uniref:Uncharacterized protein n=1 Tax=Testicularia cyperi TaxID=1882483 RepID=A0A317XPQ6_9BASI|nr:hypothetical protein BCV70DRAFT_107245 [Testicularia cyperi]
MVKAWLSLNSGSGPTEQGTNQAQQLIGNAPSRYTGSESLPFFGQIVCATIRAEVERRLYSRASVACAHDAAFQLMFLLQSKTFGLFTTYAAAFHPALLTLMTICQTP